MGNKPNTIRKSKDNQMCNKLFYQHGNTILTTWTAFLRIFQNAKKYATATYCTDKGTFVGNIVVQTCMNAITKKWSKISKKFGKFTKSV